MNLEVCIVCGRKMYLERLIPHLVRERYEVFPNSGVYSLDKVWLWNNTKTDEDEEYLYEIEKKYDFIEVFNIPLPSKRLRTSKDVSRFYKHFNKAGTIYTKIDDDVVWIEPNFFRMLREYWMQNVDFIDGKLVPRVGLIISNTINNNRCAYHQQKQGKVLQEIPKLSDKASDGIWCPDWAYLAFEVHKEFSESIKNGTIRDWYFPDVLTFRRVSINCISWMKGSLPFWKLDSLLDDESFFTEEKYLQDRGGKPNLIMGMGIVSHFSYYTQRNFKRTEDEKTLDDLLPELYPIIQN